MLPYINASTTNLLVPILHFVMHLEIHQSNKQQKTKVHHTISFYGNDIFWKCCNINLLLHSTFNRATTRPMQFLWQAPYHLFLGKQHPNKPKSSLHSTQMQGAKLNRHCSMLPTSNEFVYDPFVTIHERTKIHHSKKQMLYNNTMNITVLGRLSQ